MAQAVAEPQVMTEEELALFGARRYTPIILISTAFLAAGNLQGVRSGWSARPSAAASVQPMTSAPTSSVMIRDPNMDPRSQESNG